MLPLRALTPHDGDSVEQIQQLCYPPSAIESVDALLSISTASPSTCLVAEKAGEIVAYLFAHPWLPNHLPALDTPLENIPPDANTLFVHDLAVAPAARGSGLARKLVNHVIDSALSQGLRRGSALSVQGTTEFWRRFGFVERPDLTGRFQADVLGFYKIGFEFMTADELHPAA